MGKCTKCGKKIKYNKFVMYDGRVLCNPCNIARLLKEANDKAKAKADRATRKLLKPSRKTKKAAKGQGLDFTIIDENPKYTKEDIEDDEGKTSEDSRN